MKAEQLRAYTRKELAELAKRDRVTGWHSMRKEELVQALLASRRRRKRAGRSARNGHRSSDGRHAAGNGKATVGASRRHEGRRSRAGRSPSEQESRRDLSRHYGVETKGARDRVEAVVEDPYWIHVRWSFRRGSIARAKAALGTEWHRTRPVVRVIDTTTIDETHPTASNWVRDVEIHGDVDHWYIPVDRPGHTYQLQIGYRTPAGHFHPLAKSRRLRTPRPGSCGKADRAWKETTKKGKVPQRIRKPRYPAGNGSHQQRRRSATDFRFQLEAELIVHGRTHPRAELTVLGEPVALSKDGRFSLRFSLPEGRLVVPAVTLTPCGTEQRTIVLAVERNTKELEPQPTDELTL